MEELDGRLIILILFVVISAIKWVIEKMKGKGDQPHEVSESLEDIYEDFREEIRQRQTTVQQEQPVQSPPPIAQSPPPIVQHAQHTQPQAKQFSPPKKRTLTSEEQAAAARFQQLSSGKRKRRNSPKTSIRGLLSSPKAAQQAIVLSEILGKPKSMQDA
ncbi:MAG: hypothetical protein QNL01_02615 [Akkermansiaceae bacterium]|jgi:hypothetical protein|tara:strand:+ start:4761 stop:5237 length:477 start_codon:yes stop_codon:yes gene_type:complete